MGTTSKALTLLDYFTRGRPRIGLSDLARLSGINKATCFRLMTELAEHGLVEQIEATREYRIGPGVIRLATLREATVPMREAAQPILKRLAVAVGETAHMSHLVAGHLATVSFAYGAPSGMQVMMEDANFLPFHATSSGYAVLACLPPVEAERILSAPMPSFTAGTPRDGEALRARCAQVLARGWADTHETFEAGVASVAVPLFGPYGRVHGALAVAAPSVRMTEEAQSRILRHLIEAAQQTMTLWGGQVPPQYAALWQKISETDQPTGET